MSPASSPLPCTLQRSIPMEMFRKVVTLEIQFEFLGILLSFFLQDTDFFLKKARKLDKEGIA